MKIIDVTGICICVCGVSRYVVVAGFRVVYGISGFSVVVGFGVVAGL